MTGGQTREQWQLRLRRAGAVTAYALLLLAFAWFGRPNDRIAVDTTRFHQPLIRQFAVTLPSLNFHNYDVATTPGYHVAVAVVARVFGDNEPVLRCAGVIFTLLLAGIMIDARRFWASALLAAPLLLSSYVIGAGVWVLPDNAGWWLVAVVMLVSVRGAGWQQIMSLDVALAALVLVRQSHAWAIAPAVVAVWSTGRDALPGPLRRGDRFLGVAVVVLAPVLILTIFFTMWGGMVPPRFQAGAVTGPDGVTTYHGVAPAAGVFTMALLGLFGSFFLPLFWPAEKRVRRAALIAAAAVGGMAWVPNTAQRFPDHRSGLWSLADVAGVPGGRSVAIVALAAVGGFVLASVCFKLSVRDRRILGVAFLAFVSAQTTNPMVWQRYYEPFVLLWLALAAGRAVSVMPSTPWRSLIGVAVLACALLALSVRVYS